MMRTTLFAALAGHVAACDLASMGTQTEAMNSKCCAGNNCDATGVPSTCTDECRPAFETFWKDCGAYMAYVPGTEPMKDFAAQCEDSKPDGTGSKETECDAGSLLTTLLFECSGIDQNDAEQFCDSSCEIGVKDYVKRCQDKDAKRNQFGFEAMTQAEGWLKQCQVNDKEGSCHSARCNDVNDVHCEKAHTVGQCSALNAQDNNVFCRWHVCKKVGPPAPPPPHHVVRGCTDKKAINYNPEATQMAPGSCLYHNTGPPPPSMPCNAHSFYGCKTKEACENLKKQWVPCEDTVKYGGTCGGMQKQDDGQCANPCDANEAQNCHTPEKCRAASKPGHTTSWYVPPPPPPGQTYHAPDRCERGCSVRTMYTCRTEEACKGINMQWLPGQKFTNAQGEPNSNPLLRTNPGRCSQPCSAKNSRNCHTKASCEALPERQWVPSQCCGVCETSVPGNEAGSCMPKCTLKSPYNCHTQIACEAVGRQWKEIVANSRCPNLHRGRCELPCTEDHYFECRSQKSCEAIGLQWVAPVQHGQFMQEGRCAHKCSLASPSDCHTEQQCTGIGYEWTKIQYGGDIMVPPGMPDRYNCERPCFEGNPSGCKSQRACERKGKGQWVMRQAWRGPGFGGGGIDPGFGGGGIDPRIEPRTIDTMDDGVQEDAVMEYRRRRAQAHPPTPPPMPPVHMVGACEPKCTAANIFTCHDQKECTAAHGKWVQRRNVRSPVNGIGQPSTGMCEPACSVERPYECRDEHQCDRIGGVFKTKVRLGMPSIKQCDVTNAPCDASLFVAECAGRNANKIGREGIELCDDKCGQFIIQNYDRCAKHPPKGMGKHQWTTHFGPIVAMCNSVRKDPSLSRCTSQLEEATNEMNRVCCTKHTGCAGNNGAPTKCTGKCADTFVPFFQECGAIFLKEHRAHERSSIGRFYHTCTANKHNDLGAPNRKLCVANSGKTPWVDIEFRANCAVFIKYIDAKTKKPSEFVRLVAVGQQSVDQLLDVAKTVCGKAKMINRFAEDFAGILVLADIPVKGKKLKITINHPATGNSEVEVMNEVENRHTIKGWEKKFDVNVFNPEHCPDGTR